MILLMWLIAIAAVASAMYLFMHSMRFTSAKKCEHCRYDLRGSLHMSRRCPECGAKVNDELMTNSLREQPRLWMDWLGVVLMSLGGIVLWFAVILTAMIAMW